MGQNRESDGLNERAERDDEERRKTERDAAERGDSATRLERRWESYGRRDRREAPEAHPGRDERSDGVDRAGRVRLADREGDVSDETWINSEIRIDDKRVGHICIENDPETSKGVIRDIVVDREHRGRGVGTEAMRQAETEARRRGVRELSVELSEVDTGGTKEGRERLTRFWKRSGYEIDEADDEESPGIFARGRKRLE